MKGADDGIILDMPPIPEVGTEMGTERIGHPSNAVATSIDHEIPAENGEWLDLARSDLVGVESLVPAIGNGREGNALHRRPPVPAQLRAGEPPPHRRIP
jgi:hypothetical protein